jgi:hypothetical protein
VLPGHLRVVEPSLLEAIEIIEAAAQHPVEIHHALAVELVANRGDSSPSRKASGIEPISEKSFRWGGHWFWRHQVIREAGVSESGHSCRSHRIILAA